MDVRQNPSLPIRPPHSNPMFIESAPPRIPPSEVRAADRDIFSDTWEIQFPDGSVFGFNTRQPAGMVDSSEAAHQADADYAQAAQKPDYTQVWASQFLPSDPLSGIPVILCHSDPLKTSPGTYPCEPIRTMEPGTIVTATFSPGMTRAYRLVENLSIPTQQWLDARRQKAGIPYFVLGSTSIKGKTIGYGLNIDTLNEDGFILTACTGKYIGGALASQSDRLRRYDHRFIASFVPLQQDNVLIAPKPRQSIENRTFWQSKPTRS